jgi:hypothetical protein
VSEDDNSIGVHFVSLNFDDVAFLEAENSRYG